MPPGAFATISLDDPRWLRFVAASGLSLPFHDPRWANMVAECYGRRAFGAALVDTDGSVVAGAPMIETSIAGRRRRWVSLPYTDVCPPLVAPDLADGFAAALEAARVRHNVATVELRGRLDASPTTTVNAGYVHMLDLADQERVFVSFHPSQVQRAIRKAEREGVHVRRASHSEEVTRTFYSLHLETRRRLGVPVQPRRFFDLLWSRVIATGLGFVLLASVERSTVAGAVFLASNGTVVYKYGASRSDFLSRRPNHLLFWTAIRWACENDFHTFHFGKTGPREASLRRFKRQWGTREEALACSTLGKRAAPPSDATPRVAAAVIRHSPPWVCRVAGELLYRYAA